MKFFQLYNFSGFWKIWKKRRKKKTKRQTKTTLTTTRSMPKLANEIVSSSFISRTFRRVNIGRPVIHFWTSDEWRKMFYYLWCTWCRKFHLDTHATYLFTPILWALECCKWTINISEKNNKNKIVKARTTSFISPEFKNLQCDKLLMNLPSQLRKNAFWSDRCESSLNWILNEWMKLWNFYVKRYKGRF